MEEFAKIRYQHIQDAAYDLDPEKPWTADILSVLCQLADAEVEVLKTIREHKNSEANTVDKWLKGFNQESEERRAEKLEQLNSEIYPVLMKILGEQL